MCVSEREESPVSSVLNAGIWRMEVPFTVSKLMCISRSVLPDSLWPRGLQPTRLLCPWDFPDKDSGVHCHFLLQGIFPTQRSNPDLLHCRQFFTDRATWDGVYLGMRSSCTRSPVWDIITLRCWLDKQRYWASSWIFKFEIQRDIRARDINLEQPGYRYFGKLWNLDCIAKIWDREEKRNKDWAVRLLPCPGWGYANVQNRLLDSMGEEEGGMFWENSIETSILSRVK